MPSLTKYFDSLPLNHDAEHAPVARLVHQVRDFVQPHREPSTTHNSISTVIAVSLTIGIVLTLTSAALLVARCQKRRQRLKEQAQEGHPLYRLGSARTEAIQMRSWFGRPENSNNNHNQRHDPPRPVYDGNWHQNRGSRRLPGSWSSYWSDELTTPSGRWVGDRFELESNPRYTHLNGNNHAGNFI